VDILLFGHKNRLQVDLGDLQTEKETLVSFLKSNLNAPVTISDHKIILDSEKISVLELQRIVTKYVHRHNLSRTHWVSIKDRTVQINRFKGGSEKKKEKHKKNKPHQTLTQSWGL
jgi:hypothetical protein